MSSNTKRAVNILQEKSCNIFAATSNRDTDKLRPKLEKRWTK